MRSLIRTLSPLTVIAALALSATAAWACSCMPFATPEAQLQAARLVVVARAEWTRPERGKPQRHAVTRFTVERTLKGERRPAWQVAHHLDGPTCGVEFRPGQQVILFVRASEGRLHTGLCDQAAFPLAAYERALAKG